MSIFAFISPIPTSHLKKEELHFVNFFPCPGPWDTYMCTRGIDVIVQVFVACVRIFTSCSRVSEWVFIKILLQAKSLT